MGYSLGPDKWLKKADKHNPHGYFECLPLQRISADILKKLGADFHNNLPSLQPGWTKAFDAEKAEILRVVQSGSIELYKGNLLLVLVDLYAELFPTAKWICTQRAVEKTYQSRFGEPLSFEEWKAITAKREKCWQTSFASKNALYIDYQDFNLDITASISKIQNFLGIELTTEQMTSCLEFYKPRY